MKISQQGLSFIAQREGSRTIAYRDTRGIWTIGVGHTGPEVHEGLVWTLDQVQAQLAKDIAWAAAAVNQHIIVPLTQNGFDALVSFTFNIGNNGFDHSSFLRDYNAGVMKAAKDLLLWETPVELKERRQSEFGQFMTIE